MKLLFKPNRKLTPNEQRLFIVLILCLMNGFQKQVVIQPSKNTKRYRKVNGKKVRKTSYKVTKIYYFTDIVVDLILHFFMGTLEKKITSVTPSPKVFCPRYCFIKRWRSDDSLELEKEEYYSGSFEMDYMYDGYSSDSFEIDYMNSKYSSNIFLPDEEDIRCLWCGSILRGQEWFNNICDDCDMDLFHKDPESEYDYLTPAVDATDEWAKRKKWKPQHHKSRYSLPLVSGRKMNKKKNSGQIIRDGF